MSKPRNTGARGMHLYARFCGVLAEQPRTADEVCEVLGTDRTRTTYVLRLLGQRQVLHVAEWRRAGPATRLREVWEFGAGPDAPLPLRADGQPEHRVTSKLRFSIEVFNFSLVIKALEEGADAPTIAELTGIDRNSVRYLLNAMRKLRLIHIGEWYRHHVGKPTAVYRLGNRRNADRPKPARRPQRERDAAHSQREAGRRFTHLLAGALAAA